VSMYFVELANGVLHMYGCMLCKTSEVSPERW
jgi:hypothetical protein